MKKPIVSPEWLKTNIDNPDLILLDASQISNQSGEISGVENHQIPGSVAFDLKKDFSKTASNLPHMLPDAEHFEQACRKIGINRTSNIVVYDNLGVYFSPRVWWMFTAMGHQEIAVLDGGLPHWMAKGFATKPRKSKSLQTGDFVSSFFESSVKDFDFVLENIQKQKFLLIDARVSDRFLGTSPEPRKGIKSGHIKNSINLPFTDVLENGKFKKQKELAQIFENLQIKNHPLIFSCGSGVTACIVLLACELVASNQKSVFDGSWTEWAERTQK